MPVSRSSALTIKARIDLGLMWLGDRVFIDLCDDLWRAVEVTAQEWRVIEACPAKFLRSAGMLPLPEPEASDTGLSELRGLVNADGEDNFTLVVSWLVGALSGEGPFPIAVLSGEAGTGKSRLAVRMRSLVDPFVAAMSPPLRRKLAAEPAPV